jgi:hypothetical protein
VPGSVADELQDAFARLDRQAREFGEDEEKPGRDAGRFGCSTAHRDGTKSHFSRDEADIVGLKDRVE